MNYHFETKVFAKKPLAQLRLEVAAWRAENPSIQQADGNERHFQDGDVSLTLVYQVGE